MKSDSNLSLILVTVAEREDEADLGRLLHWVALAPLPLGRAGLVPSELKPTFIGLSTVRVAITASTPTVGTLMRVFSAFLTIVEITRELIAIAAGNPVTSFCAAHAG